MAIEYFGRFTTYAPETIPGGMPPEMASRVVWLQNDEGEDLYELRKILPAGALYVTVEDDMGVRVVHDDPHHVWPADGGNLYAVSGVEISTDPAIHRTHLFDPATGGLTPRPAEAPSSVTRGQALMALHNAGLLASVRALVAAHDLEEVRIWFENAGVWYRNNPYVLAIGMELELSEGRIDDLFSAAALLG